MYNEGISASKVLKDCTLGSLNPWNSKNWSFTLLAGSANSGEIRGRLYGVKLITAGQGTFLDDIDIKIDADFFNDVSGAVTSHHVLSESTHAGRFAIPK